MDMIKKLFEVDAQKAADDGTGGIWFTASTEHRDRDGDIMVADGWRLDHFKENPVFLWAHEYKRPPIGKAVEIKSGPGKLIIKVQFVPKEIDPFAEHVKRLYEERFMRTVSVGFLPHKVEPLTDEDKKQRPELTWGRRLSAELLEVSAAPVGINPLAVSDIVKGLGSQAPTPEAFRDWMGAMALMKSNLDAVNAAMKTGGMS